MTVLLQKAKYRWLITQPKYLTPIGSKTNSDTKERKWTEFPGKSTRKRCSRGRRTDVNLMGCGTPRGMLWHRSKEAFVADIIVLVPVCTSGIKILHRGNMSQHSADIGSWYVLTWGKYFVIHFRASRYPGGD